MIRSSGLLVGSSARGYPGRRSRSVLKAIHAQESRAAADQKARAIIEDLRASKMSKAADLVEQSNPRKRASACTSEQGSETALNSSR